MEYWFLYLILGLILALIWKVSRPDSVFQMHRAKGYVINNDTFNRLCFEGRVFRTQWGAKRAYKRLMRSGLGSFSRITIRRIL